jgi:hypothetical protein
MYVAERYHPSSRIVPPFHPCRRNIPGSTQWKENDIMAQTADGRANDAELRKSEQNSQASGYAGDGKRLTQVKDEDLCLS